MNTMLKEIGIEDKNFFVNHAQIQRLISKCGETELIAHEANKGLVAIKYDGKTCETALEHCKTERKHFITVVDGTGNGNYIHHFQSGESAQDVSDGIMDVLELTDSVDSILAIGCGMSKLSFKIKRMFIISQFSLDARISIH